jgi:hypothetical protein
MSRVASFAVVGLALFAIYKIAKSMIMGEEDASARSAIDASQLIAVDVVVVPKGIVADRARAISNIMHASYPKGFSLGDTPGSRRPHVTLLQMYCERSQLPLVFEAVAKVCDRIAGGVLPLTVNAISAASFGDGQMPAFDVTPNADLSCLHADLTSALDQFRQQEPGRSEYFYSEAGEGPINEASKEYVFNFRQGINASAYYAAYIL